MDKGNIKLIVAAVIGVILSVIVILFINNHFQSVQSPNNPSANKESALPVEATILLTEPEISTLKVGANVPLVVGILPKTSKNIIGFSIRLTYKYLDIPEITPVSFTPNESLLSNNWSFPINKVTVDDAKKVVTIDIAGINTSTTGYMFASKTNLGTLNVDVNSKISSLPIDVDQSITKLVSKDGVELGYDISKQ